MAIDPNIILQAQPVQSPLDSYTKIMALKDMAQQRDMRAQDSQMRGLQLQQAQREAGETQALKDAYAKNTTIGQNGMPVVNRQGILSDLTQNGYGQLASQHAMNFQDMDLKAVQRNHELAKTLVAGMQDQNSYSANVQKGIAYGVPGFDKLPAQYDPTIVERASRGLGSLEEQLKQKNTERELAAKELEAKSKAVEAGIPYGGAGGSKWAPAGPAFASGGGFTPPPKMQVEQMKNLNDAIAGSRMQQDAQQEVKNTLAAENLNEIVKQAPGGNLNKLNPQQTKLAMMELVKMAGGSVPTEGELESMTPNTVVQKYGSLLQNVTGKSQPANAGEFLQQGIDYANGIAGISKQRLAARENDIADRFRQGIGDRNYKMVKGQIENKYGDKQAKGVLSFDEWKSQQAKK